MSNLSAGIFPPARDDRVWGVRTGAVRGRWVSNCCDGIAGRRPSSGQTAGTLRDSSVLSTENQLETADRTETALPLDRDIAGRVRIGRKISTKTSDDCRSLLPPRPNLCLINQSPRPHLGVDPLDGTSRVRRFELRHVHRLAVHRSDQCLAMWAPGGAWQCGIPPGAPGGGAW